MQCISLAQLDDCGWSHFRDNYYHTHIDFCSGMSDWNITAFIFTPHVTLGYQNGITANQKQYKEMNTSS